MKNKTQPFIDEIFRREKREGCVFWPFARDIDGYAQMKVDGQMTTVHSVVCTRVHGPAPEGHETAHSCGNGNLGCVAPWHLSWKTHADNMHDNAGVSNNRGESNGRAVLDESEVREIKRLLHDGYSQQIIADMYGIGQTTVSQIKTEKIWSWVS